METKTIKHRRFLTEPYANGKPARNLTKAELAGLIPCSERTIDREVEDGRLRSMRIGKGMIRFSPEAIQEWVEAGRVEEKK